MVYDSENMFLEFNCVSKSFDGLDVFKKLSLSLKPGVTYGLVGPNACGKTTLLHSAMGLTKLDKGSIRYRGKDITGLKPHSIARLGLGIVLQNIGIFHRISVLENVLTGLEACEWTTMNGKKEVEERAKLALNKMGLADYANRPAGSLVPGEQKRLAIARTLFASRDFLLDEPVSGVDRKTRSSFLDMIRKLVGEGHSILIVEHDIDFVLQTCDEIMLLKNGSIVCQDSPDVIRRDDEFKQFYSSLKIKGSVCG